jgi:hypothetical protein
MLEIDVDDKVAPCRYRGTRRYGYLRVGIPIAEPKGGTAPGSAAQRLGMVFPNEES